MNIKMILAEALDLLEKLLNDLKEKQSLFSLLILAFTVAGVSGLFLYLLDPNVHSIFDGIWSAWVTMTHVGFGDVVPTSFPGRLLSAALILFGLVLFSFFTAILSVTLIGKNMDAWGINVQQLEKDAGVLKAEENQILLELVRLRKRMDALEKRISSGTR